MSGITDLGALKILQPGFGQQMAQYSFFTTTTGVTRTLSFTLPAKMLPGGIIYVTGIGGGGGGGPGAAPGAGGGGGGSGAGSYMFPLYIPPNTTSLNLQIGAGGTGGNWGPGGTAQNGADTHIQIGTTFLLRLRGGFAGGAGTSTAGGTGRGGPFNAIGGGGGGTGSANGANASNWNTLYNLLHGSLFDGHGSGGGGGPTSTSSGNSSISMFGWAGGVAGGASCGGAGGSSPFYRPSLSTNEVAISTRSGPENGQGGSTATAGYSNTISWGGGGGGGGGGSTGASGGNGMDGFLILYI